MLANSCLSPLERFLILCIILIMIVLMIDPEAALVSHPTAPLNHPIAPPMRGRAPPTITLCAKANAEPAATMAIKEWIAATRVPGCAS